MAKNYPNLGNRLPDPESPPIPQKIKPKRPTPKHIIIKVLKGKDKERSLKAERQEQLVLYKETL